MNTLRLDGHNPHDVALAGEILRSGGVVAIPTETVYGLAASALSESAALKVFTAKGRPADNPLIVHVADMAQLNAVWREVPPRAHALAEAFWPGPLSLILPRSGAIPDAVTGGLDTVGVRMPAHLVARAVIAAAGVPLAAPSANLSGKPSATSAQHVLDDFDGRIDAVLDGGPCPVGVESSVVDLTGDIATLLRPGAVLESDIAAILGAARTAGPHAEADTGPASPGMKYPHYATKAPITLLSGAPEDTARALEGCASHPDSAILAFEEYLPRLQEIAPRLYNFGPSWDYEAHAQRLFGLLREADRAGAGRIVIQAPRRHGRGAATWNRLWRAAGEQTVDCTARTIVGITGRSGAGKSVLAAHLTERGAVALDADRIYAKLLAGDAAMQRAILARFPEARAADGGIDRRVLGSLAFGNPEALAALSAITHPHVADAIRQRLAVLEHGVAVLDVPVLFGSGIDRLCTVTVGLLADDRGAAARIMARDGIDAAAAARRIGAQQSDDFFRRHCDIILENHGSRQQLLDKADVLADTLGM